MKAKVKGLKGPRGWSFFGLDMNLMIGLGRTMRLEGEVSTRGRPSPGSGAEMVRNLRQSRAGH